MAEDETDVKRILTSSPLLRLTDDHIAYILHRLPTLPDIRRAATVCSTLCRVIADQSFRRHLRSTHPAPYLGFLYGSFYAATEPHQFSSYARALMCITDFSFSFIPSVGPWLLREVRDGRVLLENSVVAREFAVADPISRRYMLLPLILDDLATPILQQRRLHLEMFLMSTSQEEGSFRVIYVAMHKSQLVVFEFSSSNGQWSSFPFQNWSTFTKDTNIKNSWFRLSKRYCAGGTFYWRMDWKVQSNELLVLDTSTMGFSIDKITSRSICDSWFAIIKARDDKHEMYTIKRKSHKPELFYSVKHCGAESANMWKVMKKLPIKFPNYCTFIIITSRSICDSWFAIIKARDDKHEMYTIKRKSHKPELFYSVKHCGAKSANMWKVMKKLPIKFPNYCTFIIVGATERYLLLHGKQCKWTCDQCYSQSESIPADYFLLELDTMRLEKVCPLAKTYLHVNLYTGFPPSLSLPSL